MTNQISALSSNLAASIIRPLQIIDVFTVGSTSVTEAKYDSMLPLLHETTSGCMWLYAAQCLSKRMISPKSVQVERCSTTNWTNCTFQFANNADHCDATACQQQLERPSITGPSGWRRCWGSPPVVLLENKENCLMKVTVWWCMSRRALIAWGKCTPWEPSMEVNLRETSIYVHLPG